MFEARTVEIGIDRDWRDLYARIWRPETFAQWASGLAHAQLQPGEDFWWTTQGPGGPVRIRFTSYNPFGVMDHWVDTGAPPYVYVPMRVLENGTGALVTLTLFRRPGMSEAEFAADAGWVGRDLAALKALALS